MGPQNLPFPNDQELNKYQDPRLDPIDLERALASGKTPFADMWKLASVSRG